MENREILFRAINANGEFIYGLPYTDTKGETMYFDEYSNRMCWRDEKGIHCNQPYKNGTLEQFTGLLDKNGTKIFEGDIVKYFQPYSETWEIHNVLWDNVWAAFGLFKPNDKWCVESDWVKIQHIEVVGNIHDIGA